MVDGNASISEWPKHALGEFVGLVEGTRNEGKYLFIWDKQGSVATFMQYKGFLCPMAPEVLKVALGRQAHTDVAEFTRKAFVNGMRNGENLCLDIDKSRPDWAAMTVENTFSPNFFNFAWLKEEANYKPFVREDENHGPGGINPGFGFNYNAAFSVTIRSNADNEADLQEQIANIPNFATDFKHIIME